jgi:hypothetical protein
MSRNLRRAAMTIALAAMAVLPATALTATPAQAGEGALWLGEHQDLQSKNWRYYATTAKLGGPGDDASSVFNDTENVWLLFEHSNFGGRFYCIRSGQYIRDLHSPAWKFGDKISSVSRLGIRTCQGYPVFR